MRKYAIYPKFFKYIFYKFPPFKTQKQLELQVQFCLQYSYLLAIYEIVDIFYLLFFLK